MEGAVSAMIGKELKKLSRRELVDIIYQMKKNEQQMQEEIAALQEALREKRIRLSMAGSIAEAAADITQLFSTAQRTADLYLREVACLKEETEHECEKLLEDARKRVNDMMADGQKRLSDLNACYQSEYEKLQRLREKIRELEHRDNINLARFEKCQDILEEEYGFHL